MSKILSSIKTTDQLTRFKSDLDKLREDIYKTDNSFDQYLNGEMDADIAKVVSGDLTKGDKKKVLKDYENDIEKAILIKLTVAQQLSSKFVDTVSSYVKSTIGEAAILDIIVNKRILAGAVIEYDGRIFNNTLNSIFETNRGKIVKLIEQWKNLKN